MPIQLPTPKDAFKAVTWIIQGDDHKKGKRVVLLMVLSLSIGVNVLYYYQADQRAKWYNARNLPLAPVSASK